MSHAIPCTVTVLTKNSIGGIRRCLQSLKHFDQIVVQDGFSTDGTRDAVLEFPNVVLMDQNKEYLDPDGRITDFSAVRNEGIHAARHNWILVVDADEEIPESLEQETRAIVERNVPGVYEAFRRFFVNNIPVAFASVYPALQIRLFHRSCTDGYGKKVHERLRLHEGITPQLLRTEVFVPLPEPEKLESKYHRYLDLEVRRLGVLPWGRWLRWILLWHIRSALSIFVRAILVRLIPKPGLRLPWAYEWQFVLHALRTITYTFPPRVKRLQQPA